MPDIETRIDVPMLDDAHVSAALDRVHRRSEVLRSAQRRKVGLLTLSVLALIVGGAVLVAGWDVVENDSTTVANTATRSITSTTVAPAGEPVTVLAPVPALVGPGPWKYETPAPAPGNPAGAVLGANGPTIDVKSLVAVDANTVRVTFVPKCLGSEQSITAVNAAVAGGRMNLDIAVSTNGTGSCAAPLGRYSIDVGTPEAPANVFMPVDVANQGVLER
jgi:hypothetical protein